MHHVRLRRASRALAALAALTAVSISSCKQAESLQDSLLGETDDEGTTAFKPFNTQFSVLNPPTVVVHGDRFVYLADEATSGRNFNAKNGDGGEDDEIPVLVNMKGKQEKVIAVATKKVAMLGKDIYLIANERDDSWDWNGNGQLGDIVLLHYPGSHGSPAAPDVEFVDTVDGGAAVPMLAVGKRLYYSADLLQPLNPGETNLRWVDSSAPKTPVTVVHNIAASAGGGCHLRLVKSDEGLLFATISENIEGVDHNNDGDSNDGFVLALLDATDPAAVALSVELVINPVNTPLRARNLAPHDWTVGFLVNEAHQNNFATGLNDPVALGFPPSWNPSNCPAYADTDIADDVLHFLSFAAWVTDPIGNAPQNTGLVGTNQIAIVPGYIGTVSLESQDGGCSTNGDADTNDAVFRWTSLTAPLSPFTDQNQLVATIAVGGNTDGITDLNGKFVVVVDEAADSRNHDQDSNKDNFLLAWLDPTLGAAATWQFDHDPNAPGIQAASVDWLSSRPQRDYLLLGYKETFAAKSLNYHPNCKSHDLDLNDSMPAWARFTSTNPAHLFFRFAPSAVSTFNGGLVMSGNNVFYRANQKTDSHQWAPFVVGNQLDVLLRTTRTHQRMQFISALSEVGHTAPNTDVIFTDGVFGAAFLVNEIDVNADYNRDGVKSGNMIRWTRIHAQ